MAAAAPESYIGSVISLTSKSEIRYEGVLYSINTEESSIGLRNVRSFGTEGRKKDGQQIPASDKIYEYILFRGSDIKDLQVKSSPAQSATLHNDPAIIQSQYPRPALLSTSLPSASTTAADPTSSHNAPSGIQMTPPFQGNLPPYQPGASLPSWNASPMPSSANGTSLAMPPMYWPGYYTPPNGFPHLQPPPFLRPPHGLTVPQALQPPVQYPGLNGPMPAGFPNMPELPSFLQPNNSSNNNNNVPQFSALSASISVPTSSSTPTTESLGSTVPNKLSSSSPVVVSVGLNTPFSVEPTMSLSQDTAAHMSIKSVAVPNPVLPSLFSEKPVSVPASMPIYLPPSQTLSANVAPVTVAEPVTLVTSVQHQPTTSSAAILSHTLQTSDVVRSSQAISSTLPSSNTASTVPSTQATSSKVLSPRAVSTAVPSSQATTSMLSPSEGASSSVLRKQLEGRSDNKETKQREWKPKLSTVAQSKEPLLPAPNAVPQKPVGPSSYVQYSNRGHVQYSNRGHVQYNRGRVRGRGRGRGNGRSHPVTKFTEDFDFMAMNEKFNKDEVWGHLGKSNGQLDDDTNDYEDNALEDDEISPRKAETKPVYVKDDFFDSLSCNTIDNGERNGRIKFSEQRKIDTETFGDSAKHRPMGIRGGRGPRGGGPRGRGYYGRGYGFTGRGRGYNYAIQQS